MCTPPCSEPPRCRPANVVRTTTPTAGGGRWFESVRGLRKSPANKSLGVAQRVPRPEADCTADRQQRNKECERLEVERIAPGYKRKKTGFPTFLVGVVTLPVATSLGRALGGFPSRAGSG